MLDIIGQSCTNLTSFFQFENVVSFDVSNVVDDHFMTTLKEALTAVGDIRFVYGVTTSGIMTLSITSKSAITLSINTLNMAELQITDKTFWR